MLNKNYDHEDIEARLYLLWEQAGVFKQDDSKENSFCVVMPPPNVTGKLHIGHALDNSLQDVYVRWRRMCGDNVLWQAGTDHAGIATQTVVEKHLNEEGLPDRHKLGRDNFIKKVWEWKEKYQIEITNQLRTLGASCDWDRTRFTLDEGLSKAVRSIFVRLYNDGLIYRDLRLVNWDPKLETAVSDLEVISKETKGKLYYLKYPLSDNEGYIVVATTRPETMLGDTAVAVHPDDERYQHLIGKQCILPLQNKPIPIIADTMVDMEAGSGAVKITPAHDFVDYEVGQRHDLPIIKVLDDKACLNEEAPKEFRNLDRYVAREKIINQLESDNLIEKIENIVHNTPICERTGLQVEPHLTLQWFCDAKTLSKGAIEAVETGKINFYPANMKKIFFEWMNNIQPWCISRQLWWGHRIPVWYGPDNHIFVGHDEKDVNEQAEQHYGKAVKLQQDEDVLDTWFSSALWPFSTLGWPEQSKDMQLFYPNSLLVTGWDILFFWVARMIMFGQYACADIPFRDVYLHGLIRDADGAKMSKSKGNVLDPNDLMKDYGTDAMRFTLLSLATQGRDIKISQERVAHHRRFVTKLWNISRFFLTNDVNINDEVVLPEAVYNRWIFTALNEAIEKIDIALSEYRSHEAANILYHFIWDEFADWYVEAIKTTLYDKNSKWHDETKICAGMVLSACLRLAHPFIPFVTEELWQALNNTENKPLLPLANWPEADTYPIYNNENKEVEWMKDVVKSIRRSRNYLPLSYKPTLSITNIADDKKQWLKKHSDNIVRLARLDKIIFSDEVANNSISILMPSVTGNITIKDDCDLSKEKSRLVSNLKDENKQIEILNARLSQPKFLANANAEIIEEAKSRLAKHKDETERLKHAIDALAEY